MVAWDQLSNVEISAALGVPAATVRTRLHRARRRLQTHLDESAAAGLGEASLEELLRHE